MSWLLILGANSDVARETARVFAKNGWNIYLASRDLQQLEGETTHMKIAFGVETKSVYFDALAFDTHKTFYDALNPKPNGVLLAFGLLGNQADQQANFLSAKEAIDANYLGAVSMLEIVASDFELRKSGFIVAISSVAGDRGRKSNYIYGSSKAALSAYLSGLRHRLFAYNVNVLAVKPGFIKTKMTEHIPLPEKLTATANEVAVAIWRGVKKRKSVIYVKPIWKLIMFIVVHLPEPIFKRTKL
jgi:short-subunit dehydrogenase